MSVLRFAASGLVTLVLLGLVAVLGPPAFELSLASASGGVGPGALPQFVVVCTTVLALVILGMDVATWRRRDAGDDEADEAPARLVLGTGIPVLVLLAAFIIAWHYLNFLVTAIAFTAPLSTLLAGRAGRTPRGLAAIAATSVLFCTGVWALFVHVLNVPLR